MNTLMGLIIAFGITFGGSILLALAIARPTRRSSGGQATANQTANSTTSSVSWVKTNKLLIMIGIMIALLVFSTPWLIWVLVFSDWWLGKTLVIVIIAIVVACLCEPWSEESRKKLIKRLAIMAAIMAVANMVYQKADVNAEDLKGYLAVPTKFTTSTTTITTPAPTPKTPPTAVPKTKAKEKKGEIVNVPAKVAGDTAWKHAYIFQMKSGFFRFSWDITAEDPDDRNVNWEIKIEKTGQIVSLTDIRSGRVKNPAIPQNGWVRIRADRPIKVRISTS